MTDIFCITSIIKTGNKEWSYIPTRSVYSPEERFQQTLQTIQSIRERAPEAKILLVEASQLSNDMTSTLQEKVDYFLDLHENQDVCLACFETDRKGWGEAKKTIEAIKYLKENNISFRRFFKISGRYFLNSFFSLDNFSMDTFTFNKQLKGSTSHPTVLYSVPFCLVSNFQKALLQCDTLYQTEPHGYETILPPRCTPAIYIPCVGVAGYVAIDNSFYSPTPADVL